MAFPAGFTAGKLNRYSTLQEISCESERAISPPSPPFPSDIKGCVLFVLFTSVASASVRASAAKEEEEAKKNEGDDKILEKKL